MEARTKIHATKVIQVGIHHFAKNYFGALFIVANAIRFERVSTFLFHFYFALFLLKTNILAVIRPVAGV